MKKLVGLFAVLMLACVVLSARPVSAGIPYCWFNKHIKVGEVWYTAPTTVTAPMGQNVEWFIKITVHPPYPIEDVVVTDRFGAEIEIDPPFPYSITDGTVSYYTKGNSNKVFLTWNIGTLPACHTAKLVIKISTDLNPAGKQEYTSPGTYELNSGAVLKFTYNGVQYSGYTLPISVYVPVPAD